MGEASVSCAKYLVFFFNLLFMVTGAAITTCGGLLYHYRHNLDTQYDSAVFIALMIIGVITIVVSFAGCCGAIRQSRCMICTFAIFLIVLIVVEIGLGIFLFVNREKVADAIRDKTVQDFEVSRKDNTDLFAKYQSGFNCCGLDGPSDYDGWKTPFPETCCPKTDRACTKRSADVYIEGCRTAVPNFFKDNAYILGGIAVGIGLIQLLGLLYACCLFRAFRREYETV